MTVPGAAADDPHGEVTAAPPEAVISRRVTFVVQMPRVLAPFVYIAMHVPQAPRIRLVRADIARVVRLTLIAIRLRWVQERNHAREICI